MQDQVFILSIQSYYKWRKWHSPGMDIGALMSQPVSDYLCSISNEAPQIRFILHLPSVTDAALLPDSSCLFCDITAQPERLDNWWCNSLGYFQTFEHWVFGPYTKQNGCCWQPAKPELTCHPFLRRYVSAGLSLFVLGLLFGWLIHTPARVEAPDPPSDSSDLLEELLLNISAEKIDALHK